MPSIADGIIIWRAADGINCHLADCNYLLYQLSTSSSSSAGISSFIFLR